MTKRNSIFSCLAFCLLLTGLSCRSTHCSASLKKGYKSIYIDQFRLTYLRQMLMKGYNNSNAVQEIIDNDHSGFTEPVLTMDDYKLIDSLTMIDNNKMKIDSTEGNRRAEGAQGKRPLGFILSKMRSKMA